jgi:hypothetical protein
MPLCLKKEHILRPGGGVDSELAIEKSRQGLAFRGGAVLRNDEDFTLARDAQHNSIYHLVMTNIAMENLLF